VIGWNREAECYPTTWSPTIGQKSAPLFRPITALQSNRLLLPDIKGVTSSPLSRGDLRPGMIMLARTSSNLTDRPQVMKPKDRNSSVWWNFGKTSTIYMAYFQNPQSCIGGQLTVRTVFYMPYDSCCRDMGSLIHLLKSSLGTGVLAMPMAFNNGGLIFGSVGTIIVGIICTHCVYILVSSKIRPSERS
jgi:hypothetical protein